MIDAEPHYAGVEQVEWGFGRQHVRPLENSITCRVDRSDQRVTHTDLRASILWHAQRRAVEYPVDAFDKVAEGEARVVRRAVVAKRLVPLWTHAQVDAHSLCCAHTWTGHTRASMYKLVHTYVQNIYPGWYTTETTRAYNCAQCLLLWDCLAVCLHVRPTVFLPFCLSLCCLFSVYLSGFRLPVHAEQVVCSTVDCGGYGALVSQRPGLRLRPVVRLRT